MSRRTFDIVVPLLYVLALVVAVAIQDAAGVGGVAVIGAVVVTLYFAALRKNIKA